MIGLMSPLPNALDFDPTLPGGYASPAPVLGATPGSLPASMAVLGAAPVATPAPAPAEPAGRTGLDYYTFGGASALRSGLERLGGAVMGVPSATAAAPAAAPAAQGTGLGVLQLSQLPQSPTGIGAQYFAGAPVEAPSAAPMAEGAPMVTTAAAAPPRAAQGAGAGAPDSFMGVDLRGAKQAAAGLGRVSEVGGIQMGALTGERKALQERAGRLTEATTQAEASLAEQQAAERRAAGERESLAALQSATAEQAENEAMRERETRRLAAEDAAKKLEAAQKTLDETKIDVDKAYGGAAGRIFAGLAVALGSFGASMTGGPNYAMQIVNDRINREIDAQRSELDKAKGKVSELGRLLQRNEDMLGDATKARNLARAQTFTALAADVEARAKGRELAPQQAKVVADLRARAAAEMDQLQAGIRETQTKAQLIPALERQARASAAAQEARRQQARVEKLSEKAFESQLDVQKALGIEAGKQQIEMGGGGIEPGQAAPKAVEKVLETVAKPAIGTKDIIGALRSLDTFEQGIMAYGSPEEAPGGRTYGFAQTLTPDLTEKARSLTQTRTANILDYRRAQTGTAASEAEEKRIVSAAGGNDPVANMRWVNQQRGKLISELDTALRTIPAGQRAAVRQAILAQAGATTVEQAQGFGAVRPRTGR